MLSLNLKGTHVGDSSELGLLIKRAAFAAIMAAFLWAVYIALEPFVRRYWPTTLVSWSKLLAGSPRDPLVGRDILFGITAICLLKFVDLVWLIEYWSGLSPSRPIRGFARSELLGGRHMWGDFIGDVGNSIFLALTILFSLFLLRLWVKRGWLAAGLLSLIFPFVFSAQSGFSPIFILVGIVNWLVTCFLVIRIGLLALVAAGIGASLLDPLTLPKPSAWNFDITLVGLLILGVITVYAFHTALGGRPALGSIPLDES